MLEMFYYVAAGIVLYLASDWLVRRIEAAAGRRFEYRTILFFFILLVLATLAFAAIRRLAGV
jgi:hypothetical protein